VGGGDVGLALAKDQKQRPGRPLGSPLLSRVSGVDRRRETITMLRFGDEQVAVKASVLTLSRAAGCEERSAVGLEAFVDPYLGLRDARRAERLPARAADGGPAVRWSIFGERTRAIEED
jgi:hypothetical protein